MFWLVVVCFGLVTPSAPPNVARGPNAGPPVPKPVGLPVALNVQVGLASINAANALTLCTYTLAAPFTFGAWCTGLPWFALHHAVLAAVMLTALNAWAGWVVVVFLAVFAMLFFTF